MTNQQKMRQYMALVAHATACLDNLASVIAREVQRRFGSKIQRARTAQERDNLRQYYTIQVGKENIWKQTYMGDRDLYIRLATMYGIAALVENRTSVTSVTETQS